MLLAMLMLGNLIKESGVTERIFDATHSFRTKTIDFPLRLLL